MQISDLMGLRVADFMTAEPITLNTDAMVEKAYKIFENNSFHHIPIVEDDRKLVGIISRVEINLMSDWGTRFNLDSSKSKNQTLMSSLTVADIMQTDLVTADPQTTLKSCVTIFKMNKFHSLPVVDNDELVGIITTYDLLCAAYQPVSRYNQCF